MKRSTTKSSTLRSFPAALFNRRAALALAVLALGTIAVPYAQASTLTFDADKNGANGATDGSATWDPNTTAAWYNGTATDQAWGNSTTTPNIAVFGAGGTSGIVTIAGTINVGGITFNQGGYTLSAASSGSGILNFIPTTAGGSVVFTTSGAGQVSTITDNVGFTATGGNANSKFTKTGAGTLVLSQTNTTASANIANPNWTITGGTFNTGTGLFDSILQVGGAVGRLGNNPTTVTLDAGTLQLSALFANSSIFGGSRSLVVNAAGGSFVDGTSGTGNNNNSIQGGFSNNAGAGTSLFLSNNVGINTNFQNVTSGMGGITWSGGTGTFTKANTYTGATTIRTGTLQLGDGTTGNDGSLTTSGITDNAALVYNLFGNQIAGYLISGTGTLTKNGAGTLILPGANTYAGATAISAGTLQAGAANTLASGSQVTLANIAGATLNLNGFSNAIGSLTGGGATGGNVTLGTGTLTLGGDNTNPTAYAGVISGTGGLTKTGTGKEIFTGANTYTGATTINSGGTLQVGSGGTSGTLGTTSNVVDNGSLVFNRSDTFIFGSNNPVISGTGSLTQAGTGTLILTGTNTYTGTTTINSGGTLQVSNNGFTATLGSGNVIDNGTLAFDRQVAFPVANAISGSGVVSQIGTGTLTLSGSSTYSGGTTVNSGILQVGSAAALGATTGTLKLNGGTVNPNGVRGATLDLNTYNVTAGTLTSADQSSFNGFNLGNGANALTASSANVSGTNYIGINNATSINSTGTYNLINSGSAMTGGGTFTFTGAQDLTVPVNSIIAKNSSGNFYRLTLNNTGTAEQVIVTNNNLGKTINIMPLGASITFGSSATGTSKNGTNIISYNGSGYHSQLYQSLVNDGRFNPNFVGSVTDTGAGNPSGPSILSTVGQTASEGHPGYTTSSILDNLSGGAHWLAAGNGVNPDYIPINIGGNDFGGNPTDTKAVLRYDAIISQVNSLRPGISTIATSLMYRTDVGASQNTYFNPYVPGIVYNHVLAGQNVRYVDLYTLLSPGDSQDILGGDGIHPTQAGYNKEANALTESLLYGAAYYKGGQNGVWSSVNGTTTNFAVDSGLTTDRQKSLMDASTRTYTNSYADVWFNSNTGALSTTLGADTTVRSLNFASGAAGAVSIGGANTLTIGAGGITVQQGTGAHTVSANVALGAAQTWGNVSANAFTVSGVVSGSNNLTTVGSYTTYNPGSVSGGVYIPTASTYVGSGSIVLAGNNTYTGTTTISSGTLQLGNGGAAGTLGSGAVTNNGTLVFNRSDTGQVVSNAISGTGSVTQAGTGATTLTAANNYTGTTTLTGGTLQIGNGSTGSISGAGAVNVGGGTLLIVDNNGALNNTAAAITLGNGSGSATVQNALAGTTASTNVQTAGALSLGLGTSDILNFSGNAGTFDFASGAVPSSFNGFGLDGGTTLNIRGFGSAANEQSAGGNYQLLFNNPLTAAQLTDISFLNSNDSSQFGATQELLTSGPNAGKYQILEDESPAPEPTQTAAVGVFGLGLATLILKARKRKGAAAID